MNALILQFKKVTPLCLIVFAFGCFAFSPKMQAAPAPETPDPGSVGGVLSTADGLNALRHATTGEANSAFGAYSMFSLTTGNFNTAVGAFALDLNNGDSNTAVGTAALLLNTTGTENTAIGTAALEFNDSGIGNTANGAFALFSNSIGNNNTACGRNALLNNTGDFNTAIGSGALEVNTAGFGNSALGDGALGNLTTGHNNISVGADAGNALTSSETFNIDIGNSGVTGDSGIIRIGSNTLQTAAFIVGIIGNGPFGSAVSIDPVTGQLGVGVSSERFKKDIEPMGKTSEALFSLKPVTFHYKNDKTNTQQWGLIAEDVEKVNPALIAIDSEGKPYSVRYEQVNAMLLNEFLKEHKKTEKLEATVASLIATVKEQAAQIQKVSAQLDASKPAPQVVNNP